MARYRDSVCKQCRREGLKLFLKGDRCTTDKCSFEKRGYPPGQHGLRRTKFSEYGIQLREKQKAKRVYGVLEKQFSLYFKKADRMKGVTGENLLSFLEQRLDNVVYRLGFAPSRNSARQLVRHNHFTVNGKKVNIPSFSVKQGDVVEVKLESQDMKFVNENINKQDLKLVPQWLELDKNKLKGTVQSLPTRDDVSVMIQEQLIVELYSR